MTFDEIKKRIGKNVKYYSDTDGWKSGAVDLTETDVADFANEIYLEELYPLFSSQHPHMFHKEIYADSWIASFTVSGSSSGTTLVSTTSVFTNGMVGLNIYNSTTATLSTITAYTSATTVTIASSQSWNGNTVYILGGEFTLGGDGTDLISVSSVRVLYHPLTAPTPSNDPDTQYIKAELREIEDIKQSGNEIGSEFKPYSYLTTINTATGLVQGIGLFPKFNDYVAGGLKVDYVFKPSAMSLAADVPILPVFSSIIAGGTARAFEKMQMWNEASYWTSKYERKKVENISRFKPQTSERPVQLEVNRNAFYIHRRII